MSRVSGRAAPPWRWDVSAVGRAGCERGWPITLKPGADRRPPEPRRDTRRVEPVLAAAPRAIVHSIAHSLRLKAQGLGQFAHCDEFAAHAVTLARTESTLSLLSAPRYPRALVTCEYGCLSRRGSHGWRQLVSRETLPSPGGKDALPPLRWRARWWALRSSLPAWASSSDGRSRRILSSLTSTFCFADEVAEHDYPLSGQGPLVGPARAEDETRVGGSPPGLAQRLCFMNCGWWKRSLTATLGATSAVPKVLG
jgi:hypothetical protein